MGDLISREAAIEYLMTNMGWTDEDGYAVDDADEKRAHIEDLINGVPSVPAVPLDKLCMLLGDNYGAPCFMTSTDFVHYCEKDNDGNCYFHDKPDEECWKHVLTKWMEGLDEAD